MLSKGNRMIVGIGGISRSGKTTLALELKEYLTNKKLKVLNLDDYTVEVSQIPKINDAINWEHPDSLNFLKLENDIKQCIKESDITIVEGFLIYYNGRIRNLFDVKIYLQIDETLFKKRRRNQYRNREPDWYLNHIWDSYNKYHSKFKNDCDIIINEKRYRRINNIVDKIFKK